MFVQMIIFQINYGLCEKLGIERSLCSPYHPQTNGLVEKLNGTIQRYFVHTLMNSRLALHKIAS